MKNLFIRLDNRKFVTFWENLLIIIRKFLCKISVEKISITKLHDSVVVLIPEYKKYNIIRIKRIQKQLIKVCKISKVENCIFSEDSQFLKGCIEGSIHKNKKLMKSMILEILEYIFTKNCGNLELENIYIFMNEYSNFNITIIENLCRKFKTVNIITENLKKFKNLENALYDEGILITVSNNKRKSVKNARYIINVDFENEKIEEYNLNSNSVFINLTDNPIIFNKCFLGVVINDIEITINNDFIFYIEEFLGSINIKNLLEIMCNNNAVEMAGNILEKYNGKITALVGTRGKLLDCEFCMKTLDKQTKLI